MENLQKSRRIVATAALPYANGYVHIGHMIEYLQVDFWTRYMRLRGHECLYICADDTHGTPIMVNAMKQGITPEKLIENSYREHLADFTDFQIEFSHFSSTNSPTNQALCEEFYGRMKAKNHVSQKPVEQLYCNNDKMFLPDRFVKGGCPVCKSKDQYGDNCEVCGAAYSPEELIEPFCAVCAAKPVLKESNHIFFNLNNFKDYLQKWLPDHTSPEVTKKMMEWFGDDLRPWDISRDKPYFGFPIPGEDGKFFYVWVDAPMGYISSLKDWCTLNKKSFENYWNDPNTEIYHFIGKDIIYFHALFWPALLSAADYRTPTAVFPHGRLMVNGEKMSKSRGNFISARTYLKNLDSTYLRYYYATKINSGMDDYDLNFDDFVNRVNAELIGKITNLASRGFQMLGKSFDHKLTTLDSGGERVLKLITDKSEEIGTYFEAREFAKAMAEIRSLTEEANRYFDEKAPWKLIKENPTETQKILTSTVNIFRRLSILLKPVLPQYVAKVEALLGGKPLMWADLNTLITNSSIQTYQHLLGRIEPESVQKILDESKPPEGTIVPAKPVAAKSTTAAKTAAPTSGGPMEEIDMELFQKIDLRIAEIIEAKFVEGADKLLQLKVQVGDQTKQIFAGIRAAYDPEKLLGRKVLIVNNLKPRKMKFGMSEGMVLAAGDGGSDLFILSPDPGAIHGAKVK
ncbi:MAG: methionine--tRNA ligase [Bdellovibrionota bacterium]